MKFLVLTQYFPPEIGAAPTRLSSMIRELQALGHQVEVVTALPNYPEGKIFPAYKRCIYRKEVLDEAIVHRVWVYATVRGGFRRLLNYISFSVAAVYGLLRAGKPDFLFVESPPIFLAIPGYFYSRLRGVPYILNVADLWPDTIVDLGMLSDGIVLRFLFALERWSYAKSAYVNAITEGVRNTLLNQKKVPPDKVLFLPNGVDIRRYQPRAEDEALKKELGLAGKQVILYAGTLGFAHGLENVLKAAKLLEDRPEIHFLFLGDGSERPGLEKLQKEWGLRNVSFHDFVPLDRLPPYYSIAACGLASLRDVPIFETARPSKIFAVFASGKPMIYFGNGEGARLVTDARAGVAVPPENAEALASAVRSLLANPEELRQLGANGRNFVEQQYQWSTLIAAWVASFAGYKLRDGGKSFDAVETPKRAQA